MYSIDGTPMTDYGLHIVNQNGFLDLPASKSQFHTSYFTEGYQITKRKGNELQLIGYIIADDVNDFKTKTAALYDVFKAINLRAVELDLGTFNCFASDGFQIDKVWINGSGAYGRFKMKLTIVA